MLQHSMKYVGIALNQVAHSRRWWHSEPCEVYLLHWVLSHCGHGDTEKPVRCTTCTGCSDTVCMVTQRSLWGVPPALGALTLCVFVLNSSLVNPAFLLFSIQPSRMSCSSPWLDQGLWLFPFLFFSPKLKLVPRCLLVDCIVCIFRDSLNPKVTDL